MQNLLSCIEILCSISIQAIILLYHSISEMEILIDKVAKKCLNECCQ